MDNWLPNTPGSKLTAQIREFDTKTPILFYSGAAFVTDKECARNAGAQAYLVKPVENEKLVAEVCRLIRESKMEKIYPHRLDQRVTPPTIRAVGRKSKIAH